MFGLGFGEVVLILLIALIFIGPKKLPELAKGLGKGIREFQNAAKGFSDQLQNSGEEPPKTDVPKGETPEETLKQIADATHHSDPQVPADDSKKKEDPHS